jgi:gliding motility-associated-like protein
MKKVSSGVLLAFLMLCTQSFGQTVLTLQPDPAAGMDTYMYDLDPYHVGYADGFLVTAWTLNTDPYRGKDVLKFDLSQIPQGATVTDARLSLFYDATGSWTNHQGNNASWIKRVTSAWNEMTVCWANQPSVTEVGKIDLPATTNPYQDFPNIDVTAWVSLWVADNSSNFGMEMGLYEQNPYACLVLASSDCTNPSKRPKLVITYSCPVPVAGFTSTSAGYTCTFTNTSLNGQTWFWTFGDGSTSTLQNPVHTYAAQGTYQVCLTATSPCGTSIVCHNVTITCPLPVATWNYTTNGLTVSFHDMTLNASSWLWQFGDGSTSTLQNPVHTYQDQGTYNVCLTATDSCGSDSTCSNIVIICNPPVAQWNYTGNGLTVSFHDLTVNASSWLWQFGDGGTSTLQNPVHTYPNQGNYSVCLTATDSCGSDSTCKNVVIICNPPIAQWDENANGLTVYFHDNTPYASSWLWHFGDGITSDLQNPVHTYVIPGNYQVCLTASDSCGSDTSCDSVQVFCIPPVAQWTYIKDQLTVQFTDMTISSTSWTWTFGDGTTSDLQNPQHTFPTPGLYHVCLTAGNVCGNSISCDTILVTCDLPTANWGYTKHNLTVHFADSSLLSTSWFWTFGDGSTSSEENPVHRYQISGKYYICLTAASICGSSTSCDSIEVICPSPVAKWGFLIDGPTVQFNDSTENSISWQWDFGDGSVSILKNPIHTYINLGTYQVCLTVGDSCGIVISCDSVRISCMPPVAQWTYSKDQLIVQFGDQSVSSSTWLWNFGDGSISDIQNPVHTYQAPGKYYVCLTAGNACGDSISCDSLHLSCNPSPARWGYTKNNLSVQFIDSTQLSTSWFWTFGDGSTSTDQNPVHTYQSSGGYQVCLTTSDICGSSTYCDSIREVFPITYNVITPNGDGYNDRWIIDGIEEYPDNSVIIFNRWGDEINAFDRYDNMNHVWGGTNEKNERVPDGTYYYILKIRDVGDFKGWILVRGNSE